MGGDAHLSIYIFVHRRKAEYVARCPQLDLFATGESPQKAFDAAAELCIEHVEYAQEKGFSLFDIVAPVPPELAEVFDTSKRAAGSPRGTRPRTIRDRLGFSLDRIEIGSAVPA
jgi:predicted RNase H-like HicB family nuclease